MSKSIMPDDMPEVCWTCGKVGPTDVHHIFGAANRKWSEKYGLTVHLCRECHRRVHDNKYAMDSLHKAGEQQYCDVYFPGDMNHGMIDFRQIFGRNYL